MLVLVGGDPKLEFNVAYVDNVIFVIHSSLESYGVGMEINFIPLKESPRKPGGPNSKLHWQLFREGQQSYQGVHLPGYASGVHVKRFVV